MVVALPDQVLHADRHVAQRANHSVSTSMGAPFELLHHLVVNGPVKLPHQWKAMFQFLNASGPLVLQFEVELPLQIWPRKL